MNKIFVLDENLPDPDIEGFQYIRFKSGTKDPEIIEFINKIQNPVVLITRNVKDFEGKLKEDLDSICNISSAIEKYKLTKEALPYAFTSSGSTKLNKYKKFTIALNNKKIRTKGTTLS